MAIIKLKSSDNEIFEIDEKVVRMSATLNTMLDDLGVPDGDNDPIPIQKVTAKVLRNVLKWAEHHKDDPQTAKDDDDGSEDVEIPAWDAEFFNVDQSTLFDLMLAANYLDMKTLLDMTCQCVANMMRGKNPEGIRQLFDIKNDYTPEEEDTVRRENEWYYDK